MLGKNSATFYRAGLVGPNFINNILVPLAYRDFIKNLILEQTRKMRGCFAWKGHFKTGL